MTESNANNDIQAIEELLTPDPWGQAEARKRGEASANLIPVNEFHDWDYANPQSLTCVNHPDLRWYWKGPGRNLHFSFTSAKSNDWKECECPFHDLRVIR